MDRLDRIEKLVEETAKTQKETAKRFKETDRELDKRFKETAERFKEMREEFKETDRELDKRFKETDRMMKETDRKMKETDSMIGDLTDGWGRWVEGSVAPSAVKTFLELGYRMLVDYHRVKVHQNGRVVAEYDTMLVAEKEKRKVLFLGEAKSFFASSDIKEFLNDLQNVKNYLEEFQRHEIIGFIAGMNYGKGADIFAMRSGLYVFKPSGETMVLDVPERFKPKIWE